MDGSVVKDLFFLLLNCTSDNEIDGLIARNLNIYQGLNWKKIDTRLNFEPTSYKLEPIRLFGLLLKQAIDSVVMRQSSLRGIRVNYKNKISELRLQVFPESGQWINYARMKAQAQLVQVHADGDRFNTSLTILDGGTGSEFLDVIEFKTRNEYLLPIAFCGENGYMLLGSKNQDLENSFSFTLIRKHKTSAHALEILKINDKNLSFSLTHVLLNGVDVRFTTGTIKKIYSYHLPLGSRSVIASDLLESIQEFLYEPLIPILFKDQVKRYDKDIFLEKVCFGLHYKLQKFGSECIERVLRLKYCQSNIGEFEIECFIFKNRINGKHEQITKQRIKKGFFKNGMAILFIEKGWVNKYLENDFISDQLGFGNLKNHLLIVVNCDNLIQRSKDALCQTGGNEITLQIVKYLVVQLKNSELPKIDETRESRDN